MVCVVGSLRERERERELNNTTTNKKPDSKKSDRATESKQQTWVM
jgi:hypothetical protein